MQKLLTKIIIILVRLSTRPDEPDLERKAFYDSLYACDLERCGRSKINAPLLRQGDVDEV